MQPASRVAATATTVVGRRTPGWIEPHAATSVSVQVAPLLAQVYRETLRLLLREQLPPRVSHRDIVRFLTPVQPAVLRNVSRHRESRSSATYLQPSYAVTEVCISSRWEIDGSLLPVQSRLQVGGIACFFVARVHANRWYYLLSFPSRLVLQRRSCVRVGGHKGICACTQVDRCATQVDRLLLFPCAHRPPYRLPRAERSFLPLCDRVVHPLVRRECARVSALFRGLYLLLLLLHWWRGRWSRCFRNQSKPFPQCGGLLRRAQFRLFLRRFRLRDGLLRARLRHKRWAGLLVQCWRLRARWFCPATRGYERS